jgi:hypothetical protein
LTVSADVVAFVVAILKPLFGVVSAGQVLAHLVGAFVCSDAAFQICPLDRPTTLLCKTGALACDFSHLR